ncbi:MAG: hypothetical protein R8G66_28955 [Cytophagales bacterium]|nr:hypothetical protein [Cytophagales bacterium]
MIGLLTKHWKFILDVAIVAAIVILVFLWNPLNLFGSGLKLQSTANMVSKVNEIGELITAEYYGEVIAHDNLQEVEIEQPNYFDETGALYYLELKDSIAKYFQNEYESGLSVIEDKDFRPAKEERKINKLIGNIKSQTIKKYVDFYKTEGTRTYEEENLWYPLFLYLSEYEHKQRTKAKKFIKNEKYVGRVLKEVISKEVNLIAESITGNPAYDGYSLQSFTSTKSFKEVYYDYIDRQDAIIGGKKNNELALIGRGSVKAGFRFGEFNDRNFVYDESRNVIHLYGFNAEILTQDINPWFIPQKRVPGFEVLIAEKDVSFEEMKALKSKCVKVLRERAKAAGILKAAQENGEEALKEFFNLVLDEEVQDVIFHKDELFFHEDEILKDEVISIAELRTIEATYRSNLKLINESKSKAVRMRREKLLVSFLQELQTSKIQYEQKEDTTTTVISIPFNYFTRHIPKLMADGRLIDKMEGSETFESELEFIVKDLRHNPVSANQNSPYRNLPEQMSYWFEDSLQYLVQFNVFLDHLFTDDFKGVYDVVIVEGESLEDTPENLLIADSYIAENEYEEYVRKDDMIHFLKYELKPGHTKIERYGINDSLFQATLLDDKTEFDLLWVPPDSVVEKQVNSLFSNVLYDWKEDDFDPYSIRELDSVKYLIVNSHPDTLLSYKIIAQGSLDEPFQLNGKNYKRGGSLNTRLSTVNSFFEEVRLKELSNTWYLTSELGNAVTDDFFVRKAEEEVYWYKGGPMFAITKQNVVDHLDLLGIKRRDLKKEQEAIRWAIYERRSTYQSSGTVGQLRMRANSFIEKDSTISTSVKDGRKWMNDKIRDLKGAVK